MRMQFGFFPDPLDFKVGDIAVSTLSGLDDAVQGVRSSGLIERGWCHAPAARCKDIVSGAVRTLPYSARVFGLPQTHALEHATATHPDQLHFLIWTLSFIHGMRLTDTEAGFLDATPIEPGHLHDIVWTGKSEQNALAIADGFYRRHVANPRISQAVSGIVHTLFMSHTPTYLNFEEFIYLYTALDGCYFVHCLINAQSPRGGRHSDRVATLCAAYKCPVPTWADAQTGTIAGHRNETLHEGLFFDEPLGFQIFGGAPAQTSSAPYRNTLLEMRCLVCRFICAILGFNDLDYISSAVNTRQRFGVQL